jgi:hypothetical protein
MKSNKIWLLGLVVVFVVTYFAISTARAQDLSGWVGKWFKLTYKSNGFETFKSQSHTPGPQIETTPVYLKIAAWDTTDGSDPFLRGYGYNQEDGNVAEGIIDLHYLGGTDLDFLCWGVLVDSDSHEQFTARITGKESGGILKSAAFKTMGGIYWEKSKNVPGNSKAGGFTIIGTLISESKLPPWVPK